MLWLILSTDRSIKSFSSEPTKYMNEQIWLLLYNKEIILKGVAEEIDEYFAQKGLTSKQAWETGYSIDYDHEHKLGTINKQRCYLCGAINLTINQ
jgi:hypothetical protein